MKRLIGVAMLVLALQGVQAEPGGAGRTDKDAFHVRLRQSRDGFLVGLALRGAHHRLADPGCQAVFSDFRESSGRSLQDVLDERGETGQSHLQRLFFYDGAEARVCGVSGALAFTQPGSHVVFVCNQWFREAFATNRPGPGASSELCISSTRARTRHGARTSQPGSWSAASADRTNLPSPVATDGVGPGPRSPPASEHPVQVGFQCPGR